MLDAGGGGGGGTSWSAMDVPTMWSTIESQETTPHWEMLTGWRRSFELILQHMSQVRNYRENLASAWPPDKSQASAAYIAELDDLLANLQQTYDAAVANHTAFSTATLSLSSARTELHQIYIAYTANQAKLDEFNARPKPVQYGKAPVPPQKPPVTGAQQEELNNRARALMSGLGIELVQARMSITTPTPYNPLNKVDGNQTERNGVQNSPPTIPPITPVYPDAETSTKARSAPASAPVQSVVDTPNSSRPPGLVLGGVHPGPPSTPTGPFPTQPAPSPGTPLPTVISPTTTAPLPRLGAPGNTGRTPTLGQPFEKGAPIGNGPPLGSRPMAPGGIIGPMPGTVSGPPNGTPTRINPVGGVINSPGQQPARGTSVTGYPIGQLPGRPAGGEGHAGESKRWDPDNPWETLEGVPSVLTPLPEQRVDPGPAIGLS